MCLIKQKFYRKHEDFILDLYCEKTGNPISLTNDYGMYCKDMCDAGEDRSIANRFRNKLESIMKSLEWD